MVSFTATVKQNASHSTQPVSKYWVYLKLTKPNTNLSNATDIYIYCKDILKDVLSAYQNGHNYRDVSALCAKRQPTM